MKRIEVPHRVFDLPDPPQQIYLVGELPRQPAVAVIGTRRPTETAVQFANELVSALCKQGVAIWSGGAEGIDATAHRAALRAGAPTVVVAPAGWDRPYPAQHAELFREVIRCGGGYLSLVAQDSGALPHHFFARNALLVALAQVIVIVQAGLRSGARNAAKFARRLGRPLLVVPSCPWVHQGLGCNAELALGARVLNSPKDVLAALSLFGLGNALTISAEGSNVAMASFEPTEHERPSNWDETHQAPNSNESLQQKSQPKRGRHITAFQSGADLDDELIRVVAAVESGAHSIDALCERTGLGVSVVQSDVLRLILLGRLTTDRAGSVKSING